MQNPIAVATIYQDGLHIGKTVSVDSYEEAFAVIKKWAKEFCQRELTEEDMAEVEEDNYWTTNYGNGQEIAFEVIMIEDNN